MLQREPIVVQWCYTSHWTNMPTKESNAPFIHFFCLLGLARLATVWGLRLTFWGNYLQSIILFHRDRGVYPGSLTTQIYQKTECFLENQQKWSREGIQNGGQLCKDYVTLLVDRINGLNLLVLLLSFLPLLQEGTTIELSALRRGNNYPCSETM